MERDCFDFVCTTPIQRMMLGGIGFDFSSLVLLTVNKSRDFFFFLNCLNSKNVKVVFDCSSILYILLTDVLNLCQSLFKTLLDVFP